MSNPRQAFLIALFENLERKGIPYCVMRNYQNLYHDTSSDVDLGAEPEEIESIARCLDEAADATNHRLVLRARYVNFSFVYWHAEGGFLRMDVETETRWRIFPILSAKAIIGLRRKEGVFYIPHPRHESVVIFAAALWRGRLSERYRAQLARLYERCDDDELRRTFRASFGTAGEKLAACQEKILTDMPNQSIWSETRRAAIKNSLYNAPNRRACLGYFVSDLKRFRDRLSGPPGISLLFASSARPSRKLEGVFDRLKFLFPSEKTPRPSHRSLEEGETGRLGIGERARRLFTLFKGGLFPCVYEVSRDRDLRRVVASHSHYHHQSRTFVCVENSRRDTFLAHAGTGFMADCPAAGEAPVSSDWMIEFISTVLEKRQTRTRTGGIAKGAFVVFVGLDGSGKTTVARKLCGLGLDQERFRAIRYFHWQPRLFGNVEFPLPELSNVPRKKPLQRNALGSLLSIARLAKNLIMANLADAIRVRSLLRHGALVLVDRYYYNYFLDPVSVKYYGPAWVLERLGKLFPRPDLVVVFRAPAGVLLARKQELTPEEIARQSAVLNQLQFNARQVLEVDASAPAQELAQRIMNTAIKI